MPKGEMAVKMKKVYPVSTVCQGVSPKMVNNYTKTLDVVCATILFVLSYNVGSLDLSLALVNFVAGMIICSIHDMVDNMLCLLFINNAPLVAGLIAGHNLLRWWH